MEITELSIAKLSLKEGDILVIKSSKLISMETAMRLRDSMQSKVPSGVNVVVLDRDLDFTVMESSTERAA